MMLLTWREDTLAIASRAECLPLIECGPPFHSPSKLPGNHFSIIDKVVHKLRGGVAAILVLQACQSASFCTRDTLQQQHLLVAGDRLQGACQAVNS